MNTVAKFLGNSDDVTTCECCGRSDLKSTVALLLDAELDTEPVYFGVVCAARALGRTSKEVRAESKAADRAREAAKRAAAAKEAAEYDAAWQAYLDGKAGRGADVSDGMGVSRFKQIQKLGGFVAARAGFAS